MNKITNKKARFEYEVIQTLECGIHLLGWEVKSIRSSKINIDESYAIVRNEELYWLNARCAPLAHTSMSNTKADPVRTKKLLAHKNEIAKLIGSLTKGFTLIPLSLYETRGKFKLELGLGKGKTNYDKRKSIKDREWKINQRKILLNANKIVR
ncbi:MAG: SsrA-binding protein SmpB [Methylacidiphilales bacterium]|nr:SsrA-binding protein SmpB [Candidatus Methylacidiphilales bacterium]